MKMNEKEKKVVKIDENEKTTLETKVPKTDRIEENKQDGMGRMNKTEKLMEEITANAEFINGIREVLQIKCDKRDLEDIKIVCIEKLISIGAPSFLKIAESMIDEIEYDHAELLAKLAKRNIELGEDGEQYAMKAFDQISYIDSQDVLTLNEVATALSMAGKTIDALSVYCKMKYDGICHSDEMWQKIFKEQISVHENEPLVFLRMHEGVWRYEKLLTNACFAYAEAGMKEKVLGIVKMIKELSHKCYDEYPVCGSLARVGLVKEAYEFAKANNYEHTRIAIAEGKAAAGKIKEAKKEFETILANDEVNPHANIWCISFLAEIGYTKEAERCYQQYKPKLKGWVNNVSCDLEIFVDITKAKAKKNDVKGAIKNAEEMRDLKNSSYEWQEVAKVYAEIARQVALAGDIESAKELFKEAFNLSADHCGTNRGEARETLATLNEIAKMQASFGMLKEALQLPSSNLDNTHFRPRVSSAAAEGYLEFLEKKLRKIEE